MHRLHRFSKRRGAGAGATRVTMHPASREQGDSWTKLFNDFLRSQRIKTSAANRQNRTQSIEILSQP